jgi:hypothetical protein
MQSGAAASVMVTSVDDSKKARRQLLKLNSTCVVSLLGPRTQPLAIRHQLNAQQGAPSAPLAIGIEFKTKSKYASSSDYKSPSKTYLLTRDSHEMV